LINTAASSPDGEMTMTPRRVDSGELAEKWERCCGKLGTPETRQIVFQQLVAAYTAAGRHYHDIRHIADCLRELEGVRHLCVDAQAIELAIWFHDIVYDGRKQDNEEQSAEVAEKSLRQLGASDSLIQTVRELILFTRHDRTPPSIDGKLMVDIDLASLGVSAEVFDANGLAIRREYPHVSDDDFRRGRSALLGRFLERARIYYTDAFHDRYEKPARANLCRALASL
jgi:predicted metal-dependent HD superfamily phosphohydrolase